LYIMMLNQYMESRCRKKPRCQTAGRPVFVFFVAKLDKRKAAALSRVSPSMSRMVRARRINPAIHNNCSA
jgi:hypothetical protein